VWVCQVTHVVGIDDVLTGICDLGEVQLTAVEWNVLGAWVRSVTACMAEGSACARMLHEVRVSKGPGVPFEVRGTGVLSGCHVPGGSVQAVQVRFGGQYASDMRSVSAKN
jgi:hypothetical protein